MAPSSSSPAVDELTAELARDPGNVELRRVLADAWQAAGDPRGEFVALSMSDEASAKQRAAEILAAHRAEWLAPLPDVIDARFERGFLVAVRCGPNSSSLHAAEHRWEWTTVEELEVMSYLELVPLVKRMPLLRLLCMPSDIGFRRLAREGPFPSIRVLGCSPYMPPDRSAFPNVAVVGLWPGASMSVEHRQARALGLQALVVTGAEVDDLPAALAAREDGAPELRVCVTNARPDSFQTPGWRMRVWRDEPRAIVEYVAGEGADPTVFPAIFDALRWAGVTQIEVKLDPSLQAWFDVRARGVTARVDGPGVDLSAVDRT